MTTAPMSRPLKIYKASAGSGKTFRLAVEYIKLLIDNPLRYKHILAVTFTNKATAEMKQRILGQLYGIGHNLRDSDSYYDEICRDEHIARLGLSETDIRSRAAQALSAMMHDYSRFRIETIDSFFQSIVRQLAHELHLTNNLQLDLKSDEVLQAAVQEIIASLPSDPTLFSQLISVVEERIEEGKNWNITADVTDFGRHIFNETYLEHQNKEHSISPQEILHFKSLMKTLRKQILQQLKEQGEAFLAICHREGLNENHFYRKQSGIYGYFCKTADGQLPNITDNILQHVASPSHWYTDVHRELEPLVDATLIPLLQQVLTLRRQLNTVKVSLAHLNQFMLLNTIDQKVRQLNSEENRFLLADTAFMLSQLIRGQDIPFIYEKAGVQFSHIMIDEFQDTSLLQWNNFIPLLCNSMATGSKCLLVGDVKQSIYRWRNSDWRILRDIEENPQLHLDIDSQQMEDNYRSAGRVVRFNNEFFLRAAEQLQILYTLNTHDHSQLITQAYSGVEQHERPDRKDIGYVRIELFNKNKEEKDENQAIQLNSLVDSVQSLRAEGLHPSRMAILVRNNKEIPLICQALSSAMPDLHIVSDEAFRLDASVAVGVLVNVLRYMADPTDRFVLAHLVHDYQFTVMGRDEFSDINHSFLLDSDSLRSLLPDSFLQQESQLAMTPLYELCEQLYSCFQLERLSGQDDYLFTFFDQLRSYLADRSTDIDRFLSFWDETMHEVHIPVSNIDGLRILTIHKSKGLEFDTVLLPFCHWSFTTHTPLIWCHPKEEPFNTLDLLPIDATEDCCNSLFNADYADEKLKTYVDNLNLLYVAFTRARHNLIVFSTLKGGKKGEDVSYVISQSLPQQELSTNEYGQTYTIGQVCLPPKKTKADEDDDKAVNVLNVQPNEIPTRFVTQPQQVTFRQSNLATEFLKPDNESTDSHTANRQSYLNEGVLIHELLSRLRTIDDLPAAIHRMDFEGYFANRHYRDEVMQLVHRALNHPHAREWFDARWQVINECNILYVDPDDGLVKSRRPDRVITDGTRTLVIDYKTGRQSEDHLGQVSFYMDRLTEMGYPSVSGYVWYIRRGDIVPV